MQGRDNHLLQPGDAGSYNPEDNDDICISQSANAPMRWGGGGDSNTHTHTHDASHVTPVQ